LDGAADEPGPAASGGRETDLAADPERRQFEPHVPESWGAREPSSSPRRPRRFRRGASILPSLFTTGNLFLGFWAIVKTLHQDYAEAAPLIGWAILLDMLDGRIARLTGTSSEFGGELDSLADMISFGVAPALLVYSWGLEELPRAGWLAAFLFVVCGALRLARFNVQKNVVDGRFFVGLPIPAAAGQIAALVHFIPQGLEGRAQSLPALALVVTLAFLMVSTFRYFSFKRLDLRARRSYVSILGIALLLVLVVLYREWVLLAAATSYVLSAPCLYLASLARRPRAPVAGAEPAAD
jgi:CDP-diacylglycerol--serine O-phosphatidyltransferase